MEETADIFHTFDIVIDKKNNFTAVFNRVFENTSGVCPQRNTEAQVSNRCAVPHFEERRFAEPAITRESVAKYDEYLKFLLTKVRYGGKMEMYIFYNRYAHA